MGVYLLLAVLQEYIYSISCFGLLITVDLFGSCPGVIGVVEHGGFGGKKGKKSFLYLLHYAGDVV